MLEDPRHAHQNLVIAHECLRAAEHSAVLLFAEILRRGWFRRLGHATMELYAQEMLGLSLAKMRQFLRLARALEELPATSVALESGSLPWTKARGSVAIGDPERPSCWMGSTRFLEVHHRVARSRGGSNAPENLRTLCHACHRFAHERDTNPPWPTEPRRSTMPRS